MSVQRETAMIDAGNVFSELAVEMEYMESDENLFRLTNMNEEERLLYLKRLFNKWCRFWYPYESA